MSSSCGSEAGSIRTDLCSSPSCNANTPADAAGGGWYQQGQNSCTSIPMKIGSIPGSPGPGNNGPQFAELKSWEPDHPTWEFKLYYRSGWQVHFNIYNRGGGRYTTIWSHPVDFGHWHTYSLCQHSSTSNGRIYGVWYDGVLQRGTSSPRYGTLNAGFSSEPLDISAYGNSAQGNYTWQHGAPVIKLNDTDSPPEPPSGWSGTP
jgi:hypothetical protein